MAKVVASSVQLRLPGMNRGGKRPKAGRKAARNKDGSRKHASHAKRRHFAKSRPLHVTIELAEGIPSLRSARLAPVVFAALERANRREDFRIVHVCLLATHLHLICEADGPEALSRGMQGVNVTVAKAVNRALDRKGRVVGERYHVHVLQTVAEVRNAVQYVLRNGERHGAHAAWSKGCSAPRPDPRSSAAWFPYWREGELVLAPEQMAASVVREARTFLMRAAFEGRPLTFRTPMRADLGAARRGREGSAVREEEAGRSRGAACAGVRSRTRTP